MNEESATRRDLLGNGTATRSSSFESNNSEINGKEDAEYEENGVDVDELNFADLDLTSEDINLNEIDADMEQLKKDETILKALMEGQDLRHYTSEVYEDLLEVENRLVEDYEKESDTILELYTEICSCDSVLEKLETLLMTFQLDIHNVGEQIQSLQDQCFSHQVKLKNRHGVEVLLTRFIQELSVSADIENMVTKGSISDAYMNYLSRLNQKIAYLENYMANSDLPAFKDVQPKLANLKVKAVAKVRQFLLQHITSCKSYESLKKCQQTLMQFSYLYQFIFKHDLNVAQEINSLYKEISTKVYNTHFKTFVTSISKLQYEFANKNDLLGVEEVKTMKIFSGKKTIKNKSSVFSLGKRKEFVDGLEAFKPPVSSVYQLDKAEKQPFEFLYRSMVYLLMVLVTEEMMFTQDFFLCDMDVSLSNEVFGRAITMYNEILDHFLQLSFDAIGILSVLVVIQKYRVLTSRRLVVTLNSFFESAQAKLTSRFFYIFELNLMSLKNAETKDLNSTMDYQPHYVTRRYAEFIVSILYLSLVSEDMGEIGFVKKLNNCLSRLREEMEKFLLRMADTKHNDWKSKTVFLINNYDLIVTVMAERDISSLDGLHFQKLLDIKTNDYVQDELQRSFGRLMNFVKDYQNCLTDDQPIGAREGEVDGVLREFHSNWKGEVEKIKKAIMDRFSNFTNGNKIFQKIMEDLLAAYTIFVKIIKKYFKNLRTLKHFTPETELTYEIQKHFTWLPIMANTKSV